MTISMSTALRNHLLDQIEAFIGTAAIVKLRSGAKPTLGDDASTGTVLATITNPSDYFANASSGQKVMSGTWEDLLADASGTIGHFEFVKSDGTTVTFRGTVTATGGGGDMTVDNTVVAANQPVKITSFTINAPNP